MKLKELRFFLIDLNDVEDDSELEFPNLSDEEFMNKAEELGTVYSVEGFEKAFNYDEFSSDCCFLRILYA